MERKRNNKKLKNKKRTQYQSTKYQLTHVPGSLSTNLPVPPSIMVNLKYQDPDWMYGNAGNFIWSIRFRMNSVYDPDPDVLSGGSLAYFQQYANLYNRYRVVRLQYQVTAVNNLTEPAIFVVAPTKDDVGSNYANLLDLSEQGLGKTQLLAAQGAVNKATFRGTIDLEKFSGFPGYLVDDTTSARVNADPAILWYLNIGCQSNILQSVVSFGVQTFLKYTVIFYQPKTQV